MLTESKKLEQQILSIQNQLSQCPEGKLICAKNGNRFKWYISNGSTPAYLPKKNRPLAEQLAVKKYLSLKLQELIQEKTALDTYLKHFRSPESEKLLTSHAEYRELLSPYFQPTNEKLVQWMNEPFVQNSNHPEHLTVKTASGHLVRSKSESLIDTLLFMKKIPFRYECELILGNTVLYPDFTILHPTTGDIYYWEHFGMMDDPVYAKKAYSKLQFYTANGIIPSIHLITTYETADSPLDSRYVNLMIEHYLSR